jgi:hypothetical protein
LGLHMCMWTSMLSSDVQAGSVELKQF